MKPQIRSIKMPSQAWKAACEAARGLVPDSDVRNLWAAAGIANREGNLDSRVASLVAEHLAAPVVFQVLATYRDIVHVCDVAVSGPATTATLSRFRLSRKPDGTASVVGADPTIEFTVTPGAAPWPLIRRVLPPFEAFRAEPEQTPPAEIERFEFDEEGQDQIRLWDRGGQLDAERLEELLPAELQAEQGESAAVQVLMFARELAAEQFQVASGALWSGGKTQGLLRLQPEAGEVVAKKLRPGDVAFHINWLLLGAIDVVNREQ